MPTIDTSGVDIVDEEAIAAGSSDVDLIADDGEPGEVVAEADQIEDEPELVITLGDDPPPVDDDPAKAPDWIRELRKSNREKDRALRAKDEEIARLKGSAQAAAPVVVGEKPKLSEFDFDEDKFSEAMDAWHDRKAAAAAEENKRKAAQEADQKAWQGRLEAYAKAKTTLKVGDFEDAEDAVKAVTSVTQQGLLLKQKSAAQLIYALGKNPAKLKELSAISDPIDFTIAATELALQVKVTPKTTAPPPEKPLRSGFAGASSVDSQLEKLREQAQKTGDMSKLMAYKRQLRDKEAKAA